MKLKYAIFLEYPIIYVIYTFSIKMSARNLLQPMWRNRNRWHKTTIILGFKITALIASIAMWMWISAWDQYQTTIPLLCKLPRRYHLVIIVRTNKHSTVKSWKGGKQKSESAIYKDTSTFSLCDDYNDDIAVGSDARFRYQNDRL